MAGMASALKAVGGTIFSGATSIQFGVSIDGDQRVNRVLLGVSRAVSDLKEPYDGIADDLESVVFPDAWDAIDQKGYFPAERAYVGFKKAMLGMSEGTQDPPVLRWIGSKSRRPGNLEVLYPSFVKKTHPQHVRKVTKDSLVLGSTVDYARDHHKGSGRGPRQFGGYALPRRDLLQVDERDARRWDGIMQVYLNKVGAIQGRTS